ncbi:MAG TPA: hypothetical protein VGG72_24800 [Bryobacteraceae bacterium]|jgi:hypothetical protein
MLRVHRIFLMLVFVLAAIPVVSLFAWKGVGEIAPMIGQVAPAQTVAGRTATATGFQLDARHVAELYLSDGDGYYKVEILTQSDSEIRFRVPQNVPAGDKCVAMKLVGRVELVEQPVFLKILEPAG